MLRFSLLSLVLFSCVNAFAETPKQVQEIRKAYANAQKPSSYSITIEKNRNYCAIGGSKRKVEFLFDEQKNLTLIKEGFNRSVQNYYYEYLFNKNQPYFFYRKEDTYDGKVEERLYFLGSNSFYSLPEGIKKTEQELNAIKAKFENYLNLVAQIKAYQEREYDEAEEANLKARFIKPEEGENNAEIKAIDEREKELENRIEQGKEEIHLDDRFVITIKSKIEGRDDEFADYKEKWTFHSSATEECGNPASNQLDLIKIEKFNFPSDDEGDEGEDFIFDEKGKLKKSYSWESHEGSEGILYFLNNEKVYCLKTIRIVGEGGVFTQIPVPCNLPKRMEDGDELPYFLLKVDKKALELYLENVAESKKDFMEEEVFKEPNENGEVQGLDFGFVKHSAYKDSQKLKELFKSLESALMLD